MKKGNVLIAAPVHSVLTDGLREQGYDVIQGQKADRAESLHLLGACEGVIISTRLQMDREAIDSAPDLRWIGRMGSGMEVIDLDYARQKGVACYSSPEGN